MTTLWKILLGAVALAVVAVAAVMISAELYHRIGPPARERRAREAAVQPLLQSHATREQVVQGLGLEFVDYSGAITNRQWLERNILEERVRQGAGRYPVVLFHTTMNTVTWLFFDSDGRLQDYYLCGQ